MRYASILLSAIFTVQLLFAQSVSAIPDPPKLQALTIDKTPSKGLWCGEELRFINKHGQQVFALWAQNERWEHEIIFLAVWAERDFQAWVHPYRSSGPEYFSGIEGKRRFEDGYRKGGNFCRHFQLLKLAR